jgi:cytochrome c oxidase assembly protein subunit 15
MATVLLNWPLTIAVLHNAGAALSVLLLTMLNYRLSQPVEKVTELRTNHSSA